jgi:hypothetical protein
MYAIESYNLLFVLMKDFSPEGYEVFLAHSHKKRYIWATLVYTLASSASVLRNYG